MVAVDCSDQLIYALNKIIQWKYPEFAFSKYFALFGALHTEKELLIANGHLVEGTRLEGITDDTSIYTVGLQTATVNVSIKLSIPFKYMLCRYTSV